MSCRLYYYYFFFFVGALVPFFAFIFFFLSGGKGEPARSSNATATSCCSLPIQPSSVLHPPFESRRIKHKSPELLSLLLDTRTGSFSPPTQHQLRSFPYAQSGAPNPSPPALLAAFNEQFHTLHG